MRRSDWIALAVLISVAGPPAADAQVYRWVDEDGKVHYSDTPPDENAERLPIKIEPTDLEAVLEQRIERRHRLEELEKDRMHEAEVEDELASYKAKRAKSCQQARERVASIESARRLSRVGEDGNRIQYDDERRARALAEARRQVADWCD